MRGNVSTAWIAFIAVAIIAIVYAISKSTWYAEYSAT